MQDDDETPETKLTRTKRRWAEEGRFLTGRHARPEADRLPPGQHLVRDWPVLDLGIQPEITTDAWTLTIDGAVDRPARWDWSALLAQRQQDSTSDIHCVTTWSRYDNRWRGVATRDLLAAVGPRADAAFVTLKAEDGYTTNLALADFAAEDALLVHTWEGAPLTAAHGGPVRLVVPHLYFWKSAKWIRRITVETTENAGFWEQRGYHMRGDPWDEERYS
jgi:DMSO/TMAO reductase YedYZ molybdopterin-dependent catalytic subunit